MRVLLPIIVLLTWASVCFAETDDRWPGASWPDMCTFTAEGAIDTLRDDVPDDGVSCRMHPDERFLEITKLGFCTEEEVEWDEVDNLCDFIFEDPNGATLVGLYQQTIPFEGSMNAGGLSSDKIYKSAVVYILNDQHGIKAVREFTTTVQDKEGNLGKFCWTDGSENYFHCGSEEEANPQRSYSKTYIFGDAYTGAPSMSRNWVGWGNNYLVDEAYQLAQMKPGYEGILGDTSVDTDDYNSPNFTNARYWLATRVLDRPFQIDGSKEFLRIGLRVADALWLYWDNRGPLPEKPCLEYSCLEDFGSGGFEMTAIYE